MRGRKFAALDHAVDGIDGYATFSGDFGSRQKLIQVRIGDVAVHGTSLAAHCAAKEDAIVPFGKSLALFPKPDRRRHEEMTG